jgi:hypothetical protein
MPMSEPQTSPFRATLAGGALLALKRVEGIALFASSAARMGSVR